MTSSCLSNNITHLSPETHTLITSDYTQEMEKKKSRLGTPKWDNEIKKQRDKRTKNERKLGPNTII